MNNLRTFETEEAYGNASLEYPTVSYAKDTDKVFLKKEGVELITFYVNIHNIELLEYQAEEGMTWGEWCISKYNDGDWTVSLDGNVYRDVTETMRDDVSHEEYGTCSTCLIQSARYNAYRGTMDTLW